MLGPFATAQSIPALAISSVLCLDFSDPVVLGSCIRRRQQLHRPWLGQRHSLDRCQCRWKGDIQAYGSLNSSIKTGRGDDIVSIKTVANGGWGEQEGQQKNSYNYSGSWDYNSSGSWGYSGNYSYDNRSNSSWGYRTNNNATTRPNTAIQVLTTTAGETKTSAWVELLE